MHRLGEARFVNTGRNEALDFITRQEMYYVQKNAVKCTPMAHLKKRRVNQIHLTPQRMTHFIKEVYLRGHI
jgi:hypothetical protein